MAQLIIAGFLLAGLCCGHCADVIVVGAGVSGLAAARTLVNHPSKNFQVTVLEARRDRFGGRVWTDKKSLSDALGAEADIGASFFNVQDPGNNLAKLLAQMEVTAMPIGPMWLADQTTGKVYDGKSLHEVNKNYREVLSKAAARFASMTINDVSLEFAIKNAMTTNSDKTNISIHMALSLGAMMSGLPTLKLSAKAPITHVNFTEDKIIMEGFQEVVDRLLSGMGFEIPLDLELNKVVRQVKLPRLKQDKVLVRTTDRVQYEADAVIVAVPLGVLKHKSILFDPPLPRHKLMAIKQMGYSILNKIVFEFSQVFWPKEFGIFHLVASKKSEFQLMTTWLNLARVTGRPFLMTFVGGDEARHLENQTDEELKERAFEQLRILFGDDVEPHSIVHIARSRWYSDPFARGSFSYPTIGNTPLLWDVLAEPICPYIHFAGEHTTFQRRGTVHGAYMSGLRAAQEVIDGCKSSAKSNIKDEL